MDMYTLLYTFKMDDQQGPTVQQGEFCSMLCGSWMGGEFGGRMDTCMHTAESLCCPPATITTLLTGYTPIQNKKFFKRYRNEITYINYDSKRNLEELTGHGGVRNDLRIPGNKLSRSLLRSQLPGEVTQVGSLMSLIIESSQPSEWTKWPPSFLDPLGRSLWFSFQELLLPIWPVWTCCQLLTLPRSAKGWPGHMTRTKPIRLSSAVES